MKSVKRISLITTILELIKTILLIVIAVTGIVLFIMVLNFFAKLSDSPGDYADMEMITKVLVTLIELFRAFFGTMGLILAVVVVLMAVALLVFSIFITVYGFKTQKIYSVDEDSFRRRIKTDSILKIMSSAIYETAIVVTWFPPESVKNLIGPGILAMFFLTELVLSITNLTRISSG